MMTSRIIRIALALAVLLALSWPAAAQQRADGSVARLGLNVTTPVTLAAEAEAVKAETDGSEKAEVGAAEADGPCGSQAVTSWGSCKADPGASTLPVITLRLELLTPGR